MKISQTLVKPSVALALCLIFGKTAFGQPLPTDQLLAVFEDIAFNAEFEDDLSLPHGFQSLRLMKWQRVVKYIQYGDEGDKYATFVDDYLSLLSGITGLKFERARDPKVNLILLFSNEVFKDALTTYRSLYKLFFDSEEQMEEITAKRQKDALCHARIVTGGETKFEITHVLVLIDTSKSDTLIKKCLYEELAQILGLINDTDLVDQTIFNDHSPHSELTDLDELMLRLLYSDDLRAGMDWEEAEPILRDLLQKAAH